MLNPAPCVGCTHQAGFTENSPMLCISVSEFLEQLVFRQRSVPEAHSIDLNHYYEGGENKENTEAEIWGTERQPPSLCANWRADFFYKKRCGFALWCPLSTQCQWHFSQIKPNHVPFTSTLPASALPKTKRFVVSVSAVCCWDLTLGDSQGDHQPSLVSDWLLWSATWSPSLPAYSADWEEML